MTNGRLITTPPATALVETRQAPWVELAFTAVLLGGGTALALHLQNAPGILPVGTSGAMTGYQEQALDVIKEMEKLLLSLGGLLIAGVTTILAKDGIVREPPPRPARLVLIATLVAAGLSMYFGYFTQVRILEILDHNYFAAAAEQVWAPLRWQYRLFLGSVSGLGLYTMYSWFGARPGSGGLQ